MAVAPNLKKLIIPGKTDKQAPLYYARDMRTIEQWANALATGGGGITEITSIDGSVTIFDPTGPTVDLSVPPAGLWHPIMGNPYNAPTVGGFEGAGPEMTMGSFDQVTGNWASPPFQSTAGGVLIEQTNFNLAPFAGSGSMTLNFGEIIVSDATGANQLRLTASGISLPLFGGAYTGWTNSGHTGTQLTLGSSQTTQLVKTTSTTATYWVTTFYNVSSSGLA